MKNRPKDSIDPVTVTDTHLTLPTYTPAAPDPNPMFLEKRVYQGSSGRVYPLPFIDRIAEEPRPKDWRLIKLENRWVEIWILPEIGGRIHRLRDKTNGYDVIYYQPVIKPALVGLAGPWISGGIEFNWPQHHRPSTFMPAQGDIQKDEDGSITVWLSEHDPMARMKGMHGVCLRPDSSALELKVRVHNRTDDVQTFLWWANVATEVHEQYQSFFPTDATFVADHAKRSMSTFPLCSGSYYGVDYARRAKDGVPAVEASSQFRPDGSYPENDLSWYANIPVPTSYMCMGTKDPFFGGYDHRARAGLVHFANPEISPGKKQWTWGNHEFGYAWDRLLTDPDENGCYRPYIELMAGVYTDNQPDFSYLQPGETKTWSQYWYPIREIGTAHQANETIAISLSCTGNHAQLGVHATTPVTQARISLEHKGKEIFSMVANLDPASPQVQQIPVAAKTRPEQLRLVVCDASHNEILHYAPRPVVKSPTPEELEKLAATEPSPPEQINNADELYFTGLHLEQYRHATRCPTDWWREALRRDPGDARCNLALGRWHLRRGEWDLAETHLRASLERQTSRNPNPHDGETLYQLGRTLVFLQREQEAYSCFYKATWNQRWAAAAFLALARLDCRAGNSKQALTHLNQTLRLDADSLTARTLKILLLRKLGKQAEADSLIETSLTLDPLDALLRHLGGLEWRGDNGILLDMAFDLGKAGFFDEALEVFSRTNMEAKDGTLPMIHYTRAWLLDQNGNPQAAEEERRRAHIAPSDYCFPSRLEEILVLEAAIAANPDDAHAHLFLGFLLYDRRRHQDAIRHWECASKTEPDNSILWRCLGIGYFNVLNDAEKARAAFEKARSNAVNDARLLYESDQLAKRIGDAPAQRLSKLEKAMDLVGRRDDLTVELCGLYNQTGQPDKAAGLIQSRRFQPWEGGEGQVLGQHVRSQLLLGRKALADNSPKAAVDHFKAALSAPENLAESKHLLANQSDIHFWIGQALSLAGDTTGAEQAWKMAAEFKGDFQNMSVRVFSEMTFFSAMAIRRLGDRERATSLLQELFTYARDLEQEQAKIDYFATSLPTMLLFEEDIQARQVTTARFLQAQALTGMGNHGEAEILLKDVLTRDPNHALAADMIAIKEILS